MLTEVEILLIAGDGGSGAVSFRRERYQPRGGPDGGDGGDGGSIVVVPDASMWTLDNLRRQREIRAEPGQDGSSAKKHGKSGKDEVVRVPLGTLIWRRSGNDSELVADMSVVGARVVIARGGHGGKGNARFARATRQAPRIAERGLPGESVSVRLELRLVADVGLVGLPNAGKSTLLRARSAAKPAVASYPFTTLEPHLGVVDVRYKTFVMADIPGLIEGAHEGTGLGIDFLQHIRRTRVLVHVVDCAAADPVGDMDTVRQEIEAYGHGVEEKPWIVALNKLDLPAAKDQEPDVRQALKRRNIEVYGISAISGEGTERLAERLHQIVQTERSREAARAATKPATLRPKPEPPKFEIVKVRRGFEVRGRVATEVVQMLGLESEEARLEVMRRLRRIGVVAALAKAGAVAGDRVRIAGEELEWPD